MNRKQKIKIIHSFKYLIIFLRVKHIFYLWIVWTKSKWFFFFCSGIRYVLVGFSCTFIIFIWQIFLNWWEDKRWGLFHHWKRLLKACNYFLNTQNFLIHLLIYFLYFILYFLLFIKIFLHFVLEHLNFKVYLLFLWIYQ